MNFSSNIERARALRDELEELWEKMGLPHPSDPDVMVLETPEGRRWEEADVEYRALLYELNDAGEAPEDLTREGLMRRARELDERDRAKGR